MWWRSDGPPDWCLRLLYRHHWWADCCNSDSNDHRRINVFDHRIARIGDRTDAAKSMSPINGHIYIYIMQKNNTMQVQPPVTLCKKIIKQKNNIMQKNNTMQVQPVQPPLTLCRNITLCRKILLCRKIIKQKNNIMQKNNTIQVQPPVTLCRKITLCRK